MTPEAWHAHWLNDTTAIQSMTGGSSTPSLSRQEVHLAKESNQEVRRSSRKKLKTAVAAIRMKAKHELLSHKLATRHLPQNRKTIKSQRNLKKLVLLSDEVSGVLKPLAPGEQILVGKLTNSSLSSIYSGPN
jgi:hypothetical protein